MEGQQILETVKVTISLVGQVKTRKTENNLFFTDKEFNRCVIKQI